MRILVTGATGFIGRYVVPQLERLGHEVIASGSSASTDATWLAGLEYLPYNIGEQADENLFEFFGRPDSLVHLAWSGLPNYTQLFHFEKNLPEHYHFLKNLLLGGLKDITVAGTCFEYGMQQGCLSEDMEAKPANAYAVAKDSLRRFLEELQKHHDFSLKWLRLFYMYGEGQASNSLIPQLTKAVRSGEPSFNMSAGDQVRDFLPVEKMAERICALALQNKVAGIINCSSGKPVTVKDFVLNYLEQHGMRIELNTGFYPYSPLEPMSFWGDTSKADTAISIY